VVEVERVGDDGCAHGLVHRALEAEVGVGVLRAIGVVLDRGHREVVGGGVVVAVEVGACHLGVDARERRPREPLPLRLAADPQPVLGDVTAHVAHHLDAAGQDDVGHPAAHGLDGLPDRVPRRGTGVLDPRAGDAVEADVLGDRGAGQPQLAAADPEVADHGLVDGLAVEPVRDAVDGVLVGRLEQGTVTLLGHGPEVRLTSPDDVGVSHTSGSLGHRQRAFPAPSRPPLAARGSLALPARALEALAVRIHEASVASLPAASPCSRLPLVAARVRRRLTPFGVSLLAAPTVAARIYEVLTPFGPRYSNSSSNTFRCAARRCWW